MYATTNSNNNSSIYGINNMSTSNSNAATTMNDQYHWEHSMRGMML